MTPLEKALQKEKHCNDITIINGVMYCNKNGKIILPMFTRDGENKECALKKCRTLLEGISHEDCEWKIDGVYLQSPHDTVLHISCLEEENYRYNYCPVCGKKIKAVE